MLRLTRSRAVVVAALLAVPLGAAVTMNALADDPAPHVEVELSITDVHKRILGVDYTAWGFNGQVPGPVIRITQGTELSIKLRNSHSEPHSFHTHFQHYPISSDGSSHTLPIGAVPHQRDDPLGMTGLTSQIDTSDYGLERFQSGVNPIGIYEPRRDEDIARPGETRYYNYTAGEVGTFVYHCHVFPVEEHIEHGLMGMIIVYPKGWTWDELPQPQLQFGDLNTDATVTAPDGTRYYEDVVMLSDLDMSGVTEKALVPLVEDTGRIGLVNFAAWADPYYLGPVPDNTLMRVVIGNLGIEPHSWHIHGHNFDVLEKFDPAKRVSFRTDTLLIAPGQSYETVLTARELGFWFVHDHMTSRAYAGMIGWLAVVENPS